MAQLANIQVNAKLLGAFPVAAYGMRNLYTKYADALQELQEIGQVEFTGNTWNLTATGTDTMHFLVYLGLIHIEFENDGRYDAA